MPSRPTQFTLHARTPEQRTQDLREMWRRKNVGRESSAKRGYGRKWRAYRITFLAENPLCAPCQAEGKITAATVVEHTVPHNGDRQLFWDPDNHNPMCKTHADRKTAYETHEKRAAATARTHTKGQAKATG